MSYEAKLRELGYTIEAAKLDNGVFLGAVRSGNLVFTAGQVSSWGEQAIKGKLAEWKGRFELGDSFWKETT